MCSRSTTNPSIPKKSIAPEDDYVAYRDCGNSNSYNADKDLHNNADEPEFFDFGRPKQDKRQRLDPEELNLYLKYCKVLAKLVGLRRATEIMRNLIKIIT